jgi:hypothetical protein
MHLGNYEEVIWLVGDGRSGTTWVSDLINHDKKYREMFEPFHPRLVHDMNFIVPHQYIRPGSLNEELKSISSSIFSGKFINERVDSGNHSHLYNGIIIKDIFANLLCYSVTLQFPKIKPVLLIRNPFAVAISKHKKKNWFWVTEPLDLLNQKALHEDYLLPFEELIRKTSASKNYILNQILIWSIINYVPLRQFQPGKIHICFYENIYSEPSREISKIFHFVRGLRDNNQVSLNEEVIIRPSRVIGKESNLLTGTCPVSSWKNELAPQLIDDGLKILQHFCFDNLYDEKSMPNEDVLSRIHESAY